MLPGRSLSGLVLLFLICSSFAITNNQLADCVLEKNDLDGNNQLRLEETRMVLNKLPKAIKIVIKMANIHTAEEVYESVGGDDNWGIDKPTIVNMTSCFNENILNLIEKLIC